MHVVGCCSTEKLLRFAVLEKVQCIKEHFFKNKISLRCDFGFQWKFKDAGYSHHQVYKKKLYFTRYM